MERIRTPEMRMLVGYWGRLRQGRAMPGRGELDAVAIPGSVLPYMFLIEPLWERDPLEFRFRLVGTGVTKMTGRDLTGDYMTAAQYGEHGETVMAAPRLAAGEGRTYLCNGRFAWRAHGYQSESVYLPMGAEDCVELVVCGLISITTERAERGEFLRVSDYRWRPIEDDEIAGLVSG